jgi:hypothetical protein
MLLAISEALTRTIDPMFQTQSARECKDQETRVLKRTGKAISFVLLALPSLPWVQVESSAMEEDCTPEVFLDFDGDLEEIEQNQSQRPPR